VKSIEKDENNRQSFVLKLIAVLIYVLSLFFWFFSAGAIALNAVIYNDPRLPLWYLFVISFPPVYFIYCLLCCTKLLQGRKLLTSGILLHLVLALWVIFTGTVFTLIIGIIFTGIWILLYRERIHTEGHSI
jgi:hypothetical protein